MTDPKDYASGRDIGPPTCPSDHEMTILKVSALARAMKETVEAASMTDRDTLGRTYTTTALARHILNLQADCKRNGEERDRVVTEARRLEERLRIDRRHERLEERDLVLHVIADTALELRVRPAGREPAQAAGFAAASVSTVIGFT